MAIRSGDLKTLRDAAVYAATATWYECTDSIRMGAAANTLILYVESSVASPGDVDFKIAHSPDNDKTDGGGSFYELCAAAETPEVYGPIGFTAASQLRSIVIPGLAPREDIKVYFRASANASSAKIKIRAMSIMSEAGISQSEVSIGDIEVDLESVTENEDAALEATQPGIVQTVKAANFDGSALTTGAVGTEGDAVIPKSSLYGVGYVMPVTEDGASTPLIAHDEAVAGGVGAATFAVSYNSQEFDGSAIAAVGTELDAVKPSASLYGITYTMPVTENGASTPLIAHDEAVAGGVGGTTLAISYNSQVFDGSALAAVGTELDAVKPSASLQGVSFIAPITPTGADSAIAVHDTAISAAAGGTAGIVPVVEAKTVDGAALPNSVTEGDAIRPAASIAGVGLQTLTSQAGTGTAVVDHDAAIASGEGTAVVMAGGIAQTIDGGALPGAAGAEGDATHLAVSASGVQYQTVTNVGATQTAVIDIDAAPASGIGGAVVMAGFIAKDFDGAALPAAAGTEGDAAAAAVSLAGIAYNTITDESGTLTPIIAHDAAIADGVGGTTVAVSYLSQAFDGSAIAAVGTELDHVKPSASLYGVSYVMETGQDGAATSLIAHDAEFTAGAGGLLKVIAAEAESAGSLGTVGAEGDATRIKATRSGVLYSTITDDTGTVVSDAIVTSAAAQPASIIGVGGEVVDYDTTANNDYTAAIGVMGSSATGAKPMPAGEAVANSIFVAVGDNTTTAVVETAGTKKALNVNVTDGTNDMPTMDANSRAGFVKITDGTDEADVIVQAAAFGTDSKGFPLFGKYEATPTTYTDGDAAPVLLDSNGRVVLSSDIEIGAVELKNAASDDRALISDANTARAATDHVISVQQLAADGTVPPSGSANTNAPFVKLTDAGVDADLIATSAAAQPTSVLGVAGEVVDFDTVGTDYTAAIGILGASATGAKPIITDTDGHLQIDVLTSSGQYTDDSAGFTVASSSGSAIMAVATSDSVDAGDVGALRMTVKRNVGTDLASIGGTDVAAGAAAMAASLPVTLATDDTHMGAVGMASDVDGAVHGQLRYIGDYVDNIPVQGTAAMVGSIPVTIASDDTLVSAIKTYTTDIPNIIGTDGAAGPSKCLSVAGTDGSGNIQELLTDTNGRIQCVISDATNPVDIEHGASYDALYVRLTDGTNVSSLSATGDLEVCANGGASLALETGGNLASAVTALQIIDDWDDGADNCKTVHGYAPVVTSATGTSSNTIATTGALAYNFQLENVTIKLSSDGTMAAGETFKVVLNANDGATYDVDLASWVPASESNPTSLVYIPESPLVCESGDAIDITLSANTGGDTYAIRIVTRRI